MSRHRHQKVSTFRRFDVSTFRLLLCTAVVLMAISPTALPTRAQDSPLSVAQASRMWLEPGGQVEQRDLPQDATQEPAALVEKQDAVRDRVGRLEDRMYQISQAIRKSEPEKAGRLLESLGASRGLAVRKKMEEIVKKLQTQEFSDASRQQEAVLADLQTLLKMMMEEPEHLQDRKKEIDRLQAIRERVDEIIKEQKKEKADAENSATTPEQTQAMGEALTKTKDILDRQRSLSGKTAQGDAKSAEMSSQQAQLRAETETLAEQMKPIPGKPAADELSAAAQKMQAAQDWLAKDQPPDAGESQKEAEEKLDAAINRLEDQIKQLTEKKALEDQAAQQRNTAGKTQSLSKDMKSSESGAPDSKPQGDSGKNSEGKEKGSSDEKGPKPKDVEDASQAQEEAAKQLDAANPTEAVKKQEEALKQLEKAQQELKDTLEQLRKEQQEEMLAALEARFRAMLAKQVEVSKATQHLTELGKEQWKRSDQLELGELSPKQREIGDEADKTLYILTEEGTTVAFPQIVRQIRDDARDTATRLAAADASAEVRAIQTGIELALRELIDAVKKKQEENQSGKESGGEGQNTPQPLLPGSAELKLLRSCQARVNTATKALRADSAKPTAKADEFQERIKKLAVRQEEISKMAKEMHEAMTKAQ